MSIAWIIVFVIFAVVAAFFYLGYYLHLKKEKLFKKYLKVGERCIYFLNEDEDRYCEVIKRDGDIIKVKDTLDVTYETHIDNITSP